MPLAAAGGSNGHPLLPREVAEEPLDRVDRDRAVEVGAVADGLARVVADPSVDRRQWIVGDELAPRQLVIAGLGVRQPGLDVLAGGAAGVARRQQVDVDRPALADRARARMLCSRSGSGVMSRCRSLISKNLLSSLLAPPPPYSRRHRRARRFLPERVRVFPMTFMLRARITAGLVA